MFYEYFNLGFSSILKLSLEEMANEQPELEASTGSLCWLTALNEMQINRESVDAQTFAAHFVLCLGIYAQQKGLIHTQMIFLQNDLEEPDVSDLMKDLPVESIIVPLRQMKFGHAGCKSLANIIGAVSFSSSSSSAAGTKPKNIYHGKAVREELEDPWIDEDGSVNQEFFELFASKITAILFERPGSTVDFIQGSMCLLSTEQLNRLLNLMLEAKLITRKLSNSAAHKVVVPWLQWSMEETEKVIPHYFVKL